MSLTKGSRDPLGDEIWTLVEMFWLALMEEYCCPGCLLSLTPQRKCKNAFCNYDTGALWLDLTGESLEEGNSEEANSKKRNKKRKK